MCCIWVFFSLIMDSTKTELATYSYFKSLLVVCCFCSQLEYGFVDTYTSRIIHIYILPKLIAVETHTNTHTLNNFMLYAISSRIQKLSLNFNLRCSELFVALFKMQQMFSKLVLHWERRKRWEFKKKLLNKNCLLIGFLLCWISYQGHSSEKRRNCKLHVA